MAADKPSTVSDNDKHSTKNEDYNPKLDFFSEHFDPLLALKTPNLVVPVSNARIYDNIHKYKAVVEEKQPEKREAKKPTLQTTQVIERRWLPHQLPVKAKKKAPKKNVLTRMENMEGPLQVLRTCRDKHQRVKIWIRHSHDIRGYCLAFVVAFDKHWNLALEEVEEVWIRSKSRKVPALGGARRVRVDTKLLPPRVTILESNKKTETCSRYVRQLLVRGEHVAYIVILSEENRK